MGNARPWPEKTIAGEWSNDFLSREAVDSFAHRASFAAKLIEPDTSVLDVGCAECVIHPFLPHGVRYTACDRDPVVPGVIKIDIDAREFPEGKWDCVLFLGVLSWVVEKDWVLRTARERSRFTIISNGEQHFGTEIRAAGWTLQKEITPETAGKNHAPIGLYS